MRFSRLLISICLIGAFSSCKKDPNSLTVINSESFHEKQIQLHFPLSLPAVNDSMEAQGVAMKELDEMFSLTEQLRHSANDSLWNDLKDKWNEFNTRYFGMDYPSNSVNRFANDSLKSRISGQAVIKWAELNVELLKLSGEVRFGDALETLLYGIKEVSFPEKLLKSVIYTHVFDDIYINIFGSSSMEYQHTTGGTVKLIQETNYPKGNDMILKIETNDIRYLNIFIRIPSWAVNPKVSYGNVKYVANPGEYCEVAKKWKSGDEISVSLKN